MTLEYAIKLLELNVRGKINPAINSILMEAIRTVKKAVKKLTPKKPDLEGDGYDDNGSLIYDTWICPCCEAHYEVDYDIYNHCPKCGQAIDRSDME